MEEDDFKYGGNSSTSRGEGVGAPTTELKKCMHIFFNVSNYYVMCTAQVQVVMIVWCIVATHYFEWGQCPCYCKEMGANAYGLLWVTPPMDFSKKGRL